MKTKLLTLMAIAISGLCLAQISINQSDFVTVGKTFTIGQNDTAFGLVPGGVGQQTWNFGSLVSSTDNIYQVQNPLWTPYANTYANTANVALLNNNEYQFLYIDNNAATAVGQTTMNVNVVLNPTEKVMHFPTTMGSTFTSLTRFKAQIDTNIAQTFGTIDSLRVVGKRERIVKCDAFGSLTTPLGTYETVRVKETIVETDSIFAKLVTILGAAWISVPAGLGIPNPIVDTSTTYTWYANNVGFKLLSFNYDSANHFSSNVEWLKSAPVASGISENTYANLRFYPNPSNGKVNLSTNDANIKSLRVFTADGKLIKNLSIATATTNYEFEILEPGLYFVDAFNTKNESIKKEKLIIIGNK